MTKTKPCKQSQKNIKPLISAKRKPFVSSKTRSSFDGQWSPRGPCLALTAVAKCKIRAQTGMVTIIKRQGLPGTQQTRNRSAISRKTVLPPVLALVSTWHQRDANVTTMLHGQSSIVLTPEICSNVILSWCLILLCDGVCLFFLSCKTRNGTRADLDQPRNCRTSI